MGGVGQPEGRGEVGEGEGRKREGITMASDWRGGHPHYSFCAPWPLGLASACPSAPVASPAPPAAGSPQGGRLRRPSPWDTRTWERWEEGS